eukprot:scaffold18118_cov60-Phaeocystis_antarctica.AAC.3
MLKASGCWTGVSAGPPPPIIPSGPSPHHSAGHSPSMSAIASARARPPTLVVIRPSTLAVMFSDGPVPASRRA